MTPKLFDLKELLALAPIALHDRLVVAGGYVTAPEKACDIDLWMLAGSHTSEAMQDIHRHLDPLIQQAWESLPGGFMTFTINGNSAAVGGAAVAEEYESNLKAKGHFYVGTFQKSEWPKPVQFFVTPYSYPDALLRDFDISTHQRALRLISGDLYTLLSTTSPEVPPRVTNWDTPATTLERLGKIANRYGFSVEELPDHATLAARVNDQFSFAA